MNIQRMQSAVDLREVPERKFLSMVRRTVTGLVFLGLAVAGGAWWAWPWWVVGAFATFGATVWSTQLVSRSLLALVEPVRELRRAWNDEGKRGDDG